MDKNLEREDFTDLLDDEIPTGDKKRILNQSDELENTNGFPKSVEYHDIDDAVLDFVTNEIRMTDDKGEEIPTFTLFSSQRFSEYSQMWNHTDKEGNLLLNFKTLVRDTNPQFGSLLGGGYNIAGFRRYTCKMETKLDDNGTEYYEIYSMEQPISVNMTYYVNMISGTLEKINIFNSMILRCFSALQYYIKPNGYHMSMKLKSVQDTTEYNMEERKFYSQMVEIEVLGFIIPKSSFRIQKVPKRISYGMNGERSGLSAKPYVSVEEDEYNTKIKVSFQYSLNKAFFVYEDSNPCNYLRIDNIETENVRSFTLYINGNQVLDTTKEFNLFDNDEVKIKIVKIDKKNSSKLNLVGVEFQRN